MNPIPMRKKTATKHPFIALLAREEKNKDIFRLFFRLSAHFGPHSGAEFHPNTPHNFFVARYQHMINDDLSKINHHILGKSI